MGQAMIEANDLRKRYNDIVAVDGISFRVSPGEVFGFLGPNGAGKTTTINMLIGLTLPTEGSATVAGFDVATQQEEIRPLIGVVFEEHALYERMSGRANLEFFCALHHVPKARAGEFLERMGLAERAGDKVSTYSQGMRQRLAIARALVNQPRVLFLDEPTRGLDPAAARSIRKEVAALGASGATVFLTTHYMEEADRLCQRVAFIDRGRIVALDTPQSLKLRLGERHLRLVQRDGEEVMLNLDDPSDAARLQQLIAQGEVLTLHSQEATLEDVYLELTGQPLHSDEEIMEVGAEGRAR